MSDVNKYTYNDDFFMEAARRVITEHFGYDYGRERRGKYGEYYPCFYPAGKREEFQREYKIPDITLKDMCWHYEYGNGAGILFGLEKQDCNDRPIIALQLFLQRVFPRDYQKDPWFKGE